MRTVEHWASCGPTIIPRQPASLIRSHPSRQGRQPLGASTEPSRVCSVTFSKHPEARIKRQSSLLRSIGRVPDGAQGAAYKVQQLRANAEMTRVIVESLILTAWLETVNTVCRRLTKQGKWKRWHFPIILLVNELTTRQMTRKMPLQRLINATPHRKFSSVDRYMCTFNTFLIGFH